MAPPAAAASWRCAGPCPCPSASSARGRRSTILPCSTRRNTPGGWCGSDARADHIGQVPERRGAQARRSPRPARRAHGRRSPLPHAPPLPRCHHYHSPRPRPGGERGELRGPRGAHRHPPHAPGAARVPRGAAGRERPARMRLAGPAVSRARDQGGAAAARHRPGALLPWPPARAARVHRPRGQGRSGPRPRPRPPCLPGPRTGAAIPALVDGPPPPGLRQRLGVPALAAALAAVHRPETVAAAEAGRRRLAFDEFFDQQLVQARARFLAKRARAGIRFELKRELTTRLKEHLPFQLTADQRQAIREITEDMTAPQRMHRLLMGDVGTGKTVVALFAMLLAAENGYQAAVMAPTELLAEQHDATLSRLLAPLAIRPELLLGRLSPAEKAAARERIAGGGARLVVGTHALIQESVRVKQLGLAAIDEQHRFGVEQRAALAGKGGGGAPAVLLLRATPIPASPARTLYGDRKSTRLNSSRARTSFSVFCFPRKP